MPSQRRPTQARQKDNRRRMRAPRPCPCSPYKPPCRIDAQLRRLASDRNGAPRNPCKSREWRGISGGTRERHAVAVHFGSFELAADARRLTRGGEHLHLTPKAFDLLVLLVDAAPRVVPKAELHTRLWPDSFVADTTLVGLVKEVRRVLADTGPAAPIIRTVARVGYACDGPVHVESPHAEQSRHWL